MNMLIRCLTIASVSDFEMKAEKNDTCKSLHDANTSLIEHAQRERELQEKVSFVILILPIGLLPLPVNFLSLQVAFLPLPVQLLMFLAGKLAGNLDVSG